MNKPIFLLLSLFMLSCSNSTDLKYETDEQLDEIVDKFELMGLSVGLIANGELAYTGHWGLANVKTGTNIDNDTYFRIASISKMFTSMAVMKLWEKGLVDLDVPASNYLGWELSNPIHPDHKITLRHLMDHTSGIRDGEGYGRFTGAMISDQLDIKSLFQPEGEYFTEDMFSNELPGEYFTYTNSTWGLIATIVERVSEQRFDIFCREQLFEPMGIATSFNVVDVPSEKIAALYRFKEDQWVAQADDFSTQAPISRAFEGYQPGKNGLLFGPQGSLRTSFNDLWITAQMLLNEGTMNGNQILKSETLSYFQQDKWVFDGSNGDTWESFWHSYTKGMHFIENRENGDIIFPDRTMFGHPGIAYGLLSDFYIDPETQSGIIFITNGSKNGFEYARESSFYQVEEATFKVLHPLLLLLEEE